MELKQGADFKVPRRAGVGVLRDIGHGDTKSNRNDTARTTSLLARSLGRRLTDTTFLHKLNRIERREEDDTDTDDKEGGWGGKRGEGRKEGRTEGRRLNSQSRFEVSH